jgi:hypothetical protein
MASARRSGCGVTSSSNPAPDAPGGAKRSFHSSPLTSATPSINRRYSPGVAIASNARSGKAATERNAVILASAISGSGSPAIENARRRRSGSMPKISATRTTRSPASGIRVLVWRSSIRISPCEKRIRREPSRRVRATLPRNVEPGRNVARQ